MTFSTKIDVEAVKALLASLEAGENDKAASQLDELTQVRESELYQQVSLLTENLHQTLDGLSDQDLLLQTKHDLPDAAERLDYVILTTEEASNKTLELAERSMNIVASIEDELEVLLPQESMTKISGKFSDLGTELQNIMLAQSFQDLTGQVLNRVALIISSLEQGLLHLIDQSSHDYDAIPARDSTADESREAEMKGIGPNVTSKSKQDSAQSQDDVDDLLADLGI